MHLLLLVLAIQAEITTKLKLDDSVQERLEPPLVVFGEEYVPQNPLSLVFIEREKQPVDEPYAVTDAFTKQIVFMFQQRGLDKTRADILKTPDGNLVAYRNMTELHSNIKLCHDAKINKCPANFKQTIYFPMIRQVFKGDVYNTATKQNVKIIIINRILTDIRVYMRDTSVMGRVLLAKFKNLRVRDEVNATRFGSHYQVSIRPGVDAAFLTLLAIEFSLGSLF